MNFSRIFRKSVFLFVLTASPFVSLSIAGEAEIKQLATSSEKWADAKTQCGDNYSYQVRTSSFSGFTTVTTITVSAGKVSQREYEETHRDQIPKPGNAAPAKTGYSEEGEQIGKNPRGAPALTVDELYAKAKRVVEAPTAAHEKLYVRFDEAGLLNTCFTVDTRIADDAPINGVVIANLTLGASATPTTAAACTLLKDLRPNQAAFADSTVRKPIVLKSTTDCAKYFDETSMTALSNKVDFEKQFILVFAWRGSGQDDLQAATTDQGNVSFTYQRGRTRDLRSHTRVFLMAADAKWEMKN